MNKGISFGTIVLVLILASVLAAGGAVVWSVRQVTQPLAAAERAV